MRLRAAALLAAACAAVAGWAHERIQTRAWDAAEAVKAARVAALTSDVPKEMRRVGDSTFLTIPEWNLVFGPEEYADFIIDRPPSQFPFMGQVAQFWDCYHVVYQRVEPDYPFNHDDHLMDTVIGVSTTAEYGLRAGYECTVGRIAEATRGPVPTAQDRLAARVARDYVDFVKVEPWYRFDFLTPLKRVWTDTGYGGPDQIRQWDRRYYLTSEYAIKAVYGWLIRKGAESAFGFQKEVTAVVVDGLPPAALAEVPDVELVKRLDDGTVLATLPRYQAFMPAAIGLAQHGVRFLDVAGNQGVILVSVLAPAGFAPPVGKTLLDQPLLTRPETHRYVLEVPIPELSRALLGLQGAGVVMEHVYDF